MKLLLDSVILIDHLNGIGAATNYIVGVQQDAAISVITRAEVLSGVAADGVGKVTRLLDCFPNLGIDRTVADDAAALRRRHGWRLPDAFQAAIAQANGLRLVTRNTRDFPPARHPFVLVPYRL